MGVIKRADAAIYARDAVALDLADIAQQAEVIKAQAAREAERIVAEAQAERDRLIADAREVGLAEGREQGLREGRAAGEEAGRAASEAEHNSQLTALDAAWTEALDAFVGSREHLIVGCKQDVLRMVLAIAQRVVHRVIEADESVVADQLESVLRLVARPTRVVIAVNPTDAAIAERSIPSLVSRIRTVEHAELIEDESLARGSVVVRTEAGGSIDASVETQLDRIAAMLVPGSESMLRRGESEQIEPSEDRGDLAA